MSPPEAVRPLVVVGAAAGTARWFGDNVLTALPWSAVTLLDASASVNAVDTAYPASTRSGLVGTDGPLDEALRVAFAEPGAVVVVGVPFDTLASVAAWLVPLLGPGTTVVDLSHDRVRADEIYAAAALGHAPAPIVVGVHALFGTSAESADGQSFVVCPAGTDPDAHRFVAEALEAAGGTVNVLSAARHDEIMRAVQTATHHALLSFADVVGSVATEHGLDIEHDLWANRTPMFELLAGLTSRVLTPGQEATTASIQLADPTGVIDDAYRGAGARLRDAHDGGSAALGDYLAALREPFASGLFTKFQQVGALATSAVQATRAQISRQRRTQDLIGVRSLVGGDRMHVGRIVRSSPTSFVLEDMLVGSPGRGALLTDAGAIANARRLGIGGKTRRVEFALGRVRVLSADELDTALDSWLALVQRGTKVLVPESISGESAVRIVAGVAGVRSAQLITEEVRLGQREIVVRFGARIDADLDDIERAIQHRIDEVFVWPDGVVLPIQRAVDRIAYLGPAGTFSDTAARQLARLVGAQMDSRTELAEFPMVIDAVSSGAVQLAVIPIANSSSGLVDLAAGALLGAPAGVIAGGVVDVLVRFDVYVAPGGSLKPGDKVFTHPQVIRQCSTFIAANNLEPVECSSSVEACRRVAETGCGVAIANVGLEAETGLELARASVGNLAGAVTRFLVVGAEGAFGVSPRADATLRTVWLADDSSRLDTSSTPRFDEVLVGPSGRMLLVSTDEGRLAAGNGVRCMGTIPWSPRTPLVVVG